MRLESEEYSDAVGCQRSTRRPVRTRLAHRAGERLGLADINARTIENADRFVYAAADDFGYLGIGGELLGARDWLASRRRGPGVEP